MTPETHFTRSEDGVRLGYETTGTGPTVVLVGAALSDRRDHRRLARRLSTKLTVVNYDRRGRGSSEGHGSGGVDNEIADLTAVINATGGIASVFGSSSGAVLALRAAERLGPAVSRVIAYEPPLILDDTRPPVAARQATEVSRLLAEGHNAAAVRYFFGAIMGIPRAGVLAMRLMPGWSRMVGMAPTLRNDLAVMAGLQDGTPLPQDTFADVSAPTLILTGSKSEMFFHNGAASLAAGLPHGEAQVLQGLHHGSAVMGSATLAEAISGFVTTPARTDRSWS